MLSRLRTFYTLLITILLLAQTTVNVTHRPVTQTPARLPIPRAPANHQVVYTTLPTPSGQNPVRTTVMQSPSLRQVNPQNSGKLICQRTVYILADVQLYLGSNGDANFVRIRQIYCSRKLAQKARCKHTYSKHFEIGL